VTKLNIGTTRIIGCLAAAATALIIGIGNLPASAQGNKIEKPNITFGVYPIINYGLIYLALKQGIFQQEGLNVTPRVMGANPIAGIVGGDFDTGGVTWTAFLTATNRGIPLEPISEADRGVPKQAMFLVKNDSPIKSIDDFLGKKVAVVTVGGGCDLIVNDMLKKKGLDYKQIGYTVMSVPDMPPTLLRGGIDAACITEPLLTALQAQGGLRPMHDLFSGDYEGFPVIGFAVTKTFAETNPNTVAALKRALAKALAYANTHQDELRDVFPTFTTVQPELARKIVLSYNPPKSDFTKLKGVAELMDRLQVLPGGTKLPDVATAR
jgi:NitT/TauT family transport system substrate-binding protein